MAIRKKFRKRPINQHLVNVSAKQLNDSNRNCKMPTNYWLVYGGILSIAAMLWSYWPTLVEMVRQWSRQPDYSHGFLVLPIAIYFAWCRRSTFPRNRISTSFFGAVALLVVAALRFVAALYYLVPLDGWTIPLTVAGIVWLLYGWPALWWGLPSIIFLWFMVPIPYFAERGLSVPLQTLATQLSTATLVSLKQSAMAEGNVILLGDHRLFVEEACSGLRIFMGVFALAFAFVLFSSWDWWKKALVLIAVFPVAVIANVIRIVATSLLMQWISQEAGRKFSHDLAGIFIIPLAAAIFWLLLLYLDRLFPEVEDVSRPQVIRQFPSEN